jgi:hypothetical protein
MGATTKTTKTYAQLIGDPAPWDMKAIAAALDVRDQTVRSWRKDSLAAARAAASGQAVVPHPNQLPEPDWPVDGKPMWKAGTIRRWAIQTGRMSKTGEPKRLKPPGRPRAARTTTSTAAAAAA